MPRGRRSRPQPPKVVEVQIPSPEGAALAEIRAEINDAFHERLALEEALQHLREECEEAYRQGQQEAKELLEGAKANIETRTQQLEGAYQHRQHELGQRERALDVREDELDEREVDIALRFAEAKARHAQIAAEDQRLNTINLAQEQLRLTLAQDKHDAERRWELHQSVQRQQERRQAELDEWAEELNLREVGLKEESTALAKEWTRVTQTREEADQAAKKANLDAVHAATQEARSKAEVEVAQAKLAELKTQIERSQAKLDAIAQKQTELQEWEREINNQLAAIRRAKRQQTLAKE